MSIKPLLEDLRPNGRWSETAQMLFSIRKLLRFFEKHPRLIPIFLTPGKEDNALWCLIYEHFFGHFPQQVDEYQEFGEEKQRPWYYNRYVFDPKWNVLLHEKKALRAATRVVRPYLTSKMVSYD